MLNDAVGVGVGVALELLDGLGVRVTLDVIDMLWENAWVPVSLWVTVRDELGVAVCDAV